MKKILTRILLLLIAVSMIAALSAGCKDSGDDPVDTTTASGDAADTTTPTDTTGNSYLDDLPSTDYSKAGEFNILVRTHKKWEMYAEDINGQTINDAIYNRNIAVEDKYQCSLNIIDVAGSWNDRENFKKEVTAGVLSEDECPYDLVASCMFYMSDLTTEGYFENLKDVDTLDFDNSWWVQGFVDENTVNGKLFYSVGEVCLTLWDGMFVIDFNKDMITDAGLESPYKLVKDKKWTLDKMFEMSKNMYVDTDSDGVKSDGDTFGILTNLNCSRPMIYTSGLKICKLNEDGTATMTLGGEKYDTLYKKIYDNVIESRDGHYITDTIPSNVLFEEKRVAFYTARNWDAEAFRQLEINFGILPYPLYDEAQSDYISITDGDCSMYAILVNARDKEMSGEILEALGAESAYSVIPQYYDTILKYRNTTDSESAEMLDIIRDTLFIDFGFVHSQSIGGPYMFLTSEIAAGHSAISGSFKVSNVLWQRKLDDMMLAYAKD